MTAIRAQIDRFGWSQAVAADNLGVTQPRISDLHRQAGQVLPRRPGQPRQQGQRPPRRPHRHRPHPHRPPRRRRQDLGP
uniref:hypothetical protein n=1 Tax=Rhodococcus opacus TaxID=37919 RepID=UPI003F65B7A5